MTVGADPAAAALLDIRMSGFELSYDGRFLHDTRNSGGCSSCGNPSMATRLQQVSFFLDGVHVGTLTDDVFADVLIESRFIPAAGGTVLINGGFFALLTKPTAPAFGLSVAFRTAE